MIENWMLPIYPTKRELLEKLSQACMWQYYVATKVHIFQ